MDLENKSTSRHQEENADGSSSSENPRVLKDDGTGISERPATYRRGQFGDRAMFGTRYFSSEESALEDLFQAKTINDTSIRSLEHASSGLTSSTFSISLARQSPPVQTMERGAGYDLDRISGSMFERSASGTTLEWSAASSESLFSLKIGNASFTIDHDVILSGDQRKSEEKPGELVVITPPPPIQMDETEGSKAVIGRKSRTTAKVVNDSLKEHVKEARDERFYTPRTSWDSSRASNHSYRCTTSINSTSKRTWSFCCFTGLSCSWGSCCCKMRSCSSDFSCSFCSRSRQNCCTCKEQGELCSNLSCGSLSCCSGKACSSCSLKSLCCCSGKACSSCSLKSLCCCSGKGCSGCSLKSLCCCSGKACSSCSLKSLCCCSGKGCSSCSFKSLSCCSGKGCSSCSFKSLCCCSGKSSSCSFKSLFCCSGKGCSSCSFKSLSCCSETTCTPGFCSNCDMQQLRGCWNCSCCRNKSRSSKCCG